MPTFTEWKTSSPTLLSPAQRRTLEKSFAATLATSATEDHFLVTPGSVIGSLLVDGLPIVVKPKIAIDRVLFMTAFAADPYRWQDAWSSLSKVEGLVDGMAALFLTSCQEATRRGLLRSYRWVDTEAAFIKGRIRFNVHARRPQLLPLPLRYQLHDDDIPENQVIRAALKVLRALPAVGAFPSLGLHAEWKRFRDFAPLSDPLRVLDGIVWSRLNEHYRPTLELARVVLENSMAHVDSGGVTTRGFTLNMPAIFESFVRTALRHFARLSLHDFPDVFPNELTLDDGAKVRLKPDLGVRVDGQWRFVGDVKYKRDEGAGQNADLYQLLAYATATNLPSATLLYAHGPQTLRQLRVRHVGVDLRVRHMDLSRSPTDVLLQLSQISREELLSGSPDTKGFM